VWLRPYWAARYRGEAADLSGAFLVFAPLAGAQLEEANLTNANLRGANLRSAAMRAADHTGACALLRLDDALTSPRRPARRGSAARVRPAPLACRPDAALQ
jgi:hypothetical protein